MSQSPTSARELSADEPSKPRLHHFVLEDDVFSFLMIAFVFVLMLAGLFELAERHAVARAMWTLEILLAAALVAQTIASAPGYVRLRERVRARISSS
jgi:hypothetical protein